MNSERNTPRIGISGREWALLWGSAMLFQYISQLEWFLALKTPPIIGRDIFDSLLVLFAGALLLAPHRAGLLLAMSACQVIAAALHLPDIPNHRLFSALINLSILLSACSLLLSRERFTIDDLWSKAAPAVRSLIVCLYLFAALAKANTGYLDPRVSCASVFLREMNPPFPIPSNIEFMTNLGSLILELALPLMLLDRRFRRGGILMGLLFHLFLAFDTLRHFLDFSSVAMACLLAYSRGAVFSRWMIRWLGRAIVAGSIVCISFGSQYPEMEPVAMYGQARNLLWLFYAALIICSYILSGSRNAGKPEVAPLLPGRSITAIPLLFAIYNGCTPYLGIKTKSSWDMYSNLRLEGPEPNHLIFGRGLDLLGEMKDPVTILKSTNNMLETEFAEKGFAIVPFELRGIFAADPLGKTSLIWRGETHFEYPHGSGALPLSIPPSAVARALLWFRPVDRLREPRCQR